MNVLFLVMEFAPVNTTGNFRSLKFVKYLKEFGITPIVVTLKEADAATIFKAQINYDLLTDLPQETVIYRVTCDPVATTHQNKLKDFLSIYFSLVDKIGKSWRKNVLQKLPHIVERHQPELIYTSLPPFSCGLLAKEISKKFNLPLVVDMRDLWSYWGSDPHGSYLHFAAKRMIERRVFSHASKIISVTPQLIRIFKNAHPKIDPNKFELIPNGYDNEATFNKQPRKMQPDKFIIGYVGSFYYNPTSNNNAYIPWWKRKGHKKFQYFPVKENWLYRSPYFFFKTLSALFRKHPSLKAKFRFDLIGWQPTWLSSMLKEFDLIDIYNYRGFQSHTTTLALQEEFDVLLATSEKVENGEHYSLPSKVFDYIQNGKPIIAFVTEGVQKDFLTKSGCAVVCDPDNIDDSVNKVESLYFDGFELNPDRLYLQQYHRKKSAEKLAKVFRLCAEGINL